MKSARKKAYERASKAFFKFHIPTGDFMKLHKNARSLDSRKQKKKFYIRKELQA